MQIRIGLKQKAAEFIGRNIIRRDLLFFNKQQQLLQPDFFQLVAEHF